MSTDNKPEINSAPIDEDKLALMFELSPPTKRESLLLARIAELEGKLDEALRNGLGAEG
jgi:hypothetical protein